MNLDFEGLKDGKKLVTISAGTGDHAGPMQLVLYALASCALTDLVSILQKQRVQFRNLHCDIAAQRSVTLKARPFEQIHLEFRVAADGLAEENFRRSVDLSLDAYCGVHATLAGGPAKITHSAIVLKQ